MQSHRHSYHPRRSFATPPIAPPSLLQFVVLSMLLHMLLVLLFGTSNYGGVRRGDGLLGSLDVSLRYLTSEQGSGFTIAPGADTQLPGAALLRRLEGLPAPVPTPSVHPDAASTAAPSPPTSGAPPEPASAATPPTPPAGESVPEAALSVRPPPAEALPRLDLNAPIEVDKPIDVPPVITPPVAAPPREPVLPPMQPLERIAPARIERMAPPVDVRPREIPVAPAKVEHEPVAPVDVKPREPPTPLPVPLERIAPPQIERQSAPAVELPAQRQTPVETTPAPRVAPSVERESAPAPPRSEAIEKAPARDIPAPAVIAPGRPAAQATTPSSAPATPRGEPAKAGEQPRLRLGAPDVDDEVFRSRRDAPMGPADAGAAPPGITGEAMRKRVREIASEGSGSRGVLNLVPPPPERKDKLAEDIAKAAKPDCRTAYGGLGLLAVVPLVASSVGNGGCNW